MKTKRRKQQRKSTTCWWPFISFPKYGKGLQAKWCHIRGTLSICWIIAFPLFAFQRFAGLPLFFFSHKRPTQSHRRYMKMDDWIIIKLSFRIRNNYLPKSSDVYLSWVSWTSLLGIFSRKRISRLWTLVFLSFISTAIRQLPIHIFISGTVDHLVFTVYISKLEYTPTLGPGLSFLDIRLWVIGYWISFRFFFFWFWFLWILRLWISVSVAALWWVLSLSLPTRPR